MLFAQAITPTGFEAIRALYWPPTGQNKLDSKGMEKQTVLTPLPILPKLVPALVAQAEGCKETNWGHLDVTFISLCIKHGTVWTTSIIRPQKEALDIWKQIKWTRSSHIKKRTIW
jgi:hypothetical protein